MAAAGHDQPGGAARPLPPAIEPEDLARLAPAVDVCLSSDGERVAYVIRRIDLRRNLTLSDIEEVAFEGPARTRRLSRRVGPVERPRWMPGGRALAYLARPSPRELARAGVPGTPQIFLSDPGPGGPRPLTSFPGGCRDFGWAPDGQWLVCAAGGEVGEAGVSAARVHRRLPLKVDGVGYVEGRPQHLWLVRLDGQPPRQLTDGDGDDWHPAVSPDGHALAFASHQSTGGAASEEVDILVLELATGALRRLTPGGGRYTRPAWSPDGRHVACFGVPDARGWAAKSVRLWRFRADGGGGSELTGTWDGTAGAPIVSDVRGHAHVLSQAFAVPPAWTEDGTRILFLGARRGTANVYSCATAGGDVRPVTSGAHHVTAFSTDASATRIAAIVATPRDPGQVVVGHPGEPIQPRTRPGRRWLATRFVADPEPLGCAGRDGLPLEGWLLKPRGFDPGRRWPLVLEIHGGPHLAYGQAYFHEFQVLAGRGYAVLYLNPRGSQTYGESFAQAVIGDWGGVDAEDLLAGLETTLALGWVDPQRLYVTGGSFGGFMTNWLITRTNRFRAAVSQRGISNLLAAFGSGDEGWEFWRLEMGGALPWSGAATLVERSPLVHANRIRTPLLMLHGQRDLRCPIEQAEQLFVALQALGREVVLVRYPDDGHDLTRTGQPRSRVDHCRRIADWFDAHP